MQTVTFLIALKHSCCLDHILSFLHTADICSFAQTCRISSKSINEFLDSSALSFSADHDNRCSVFISRCSILLDVLSSNSKLRVTIKKAFQDASRLKASADHRGYERLSLQERKRIYLQLVCFRAEVWKYCTGIDRSIRRMDTKCFTLNDFHDDVMCATFLSDAIDNDSGTISNIMGICHGRSESDWRQQLASCIRSGTENQATLYFVWIMIMSTFIRSNDSLMTSLFKAAHLNNTDRPLRLGRIFSNEDMVTRMALVYSEIEERSKNKTASRSHGHRIKITYYDFGPLGPFRGRDRPLTIIRDMEEVCDECSRALSNDPYFCPWLSKMFSWAYQTLPMNVRFPTVSFV